LPSQFHSRLAEALSLMHEGDRWQIVIPPNLAFGARAPPTARCRPARRVFEVTLVSIRPRRQPPPRRNRKVLFRLGRGA